MPSGSSIVVHALFAGLVCIASVQGQDTEAPPADEVRMSAATFAGLEFRSIGPALMAGRIADIAIHPERQSTWYVAVGSGNLWKTTNAGTTWTPLFEDQGSYSLGCVTLDPSDPETVWLGTGENVGGRHVGYGDGVYRSRDGGASWENMGLSESEHIGRIVVDPRDGDVVYVASQGPLWSAGGERGLFKTTDGGETWASILGAGEYTGCNEVVMDPRDPDVLYAVLHQRYRTVAALVNGGPESGIHKSTDGGATWLRLTKGLPEEDMGRIGIALSPQQPDVVYATIELAHRKGGFWRSTDGGASWEKRDDYLSGGTGPHYYQEIFASPHVVDRVYQMDVWLHVTDDGGKTFRPLGEKDKHSDNHALAFDPDDPDYLLAGCDGGLYESFDHGATWRFVANLPVTQFYKLAVDDDAPFYNIYGGTQDNSTEGGPSRTDNVQGIRNSDWFITVFADGHQPATEPGNPDIVYGQWQEGSLVRWDRPTGEMSFIQPQPAEGEPTDRYNWDAPILVSPHDPARLYHASQRVMRSDDRGDSWRPVSGDLTRGLDRFTLPMMDRVQSFDAVWDLMAMSKYGTITSLAESPLVEGLLYVGTDDGLLHVSDDGGGSWRRAAPFPDAPEFIYVNDIKADVHDADTLYVALDNHKAGDFAPYLYKSTDRGASWTSLADGLPERHVVWRLVQDHVAPGLLFVGTEFGVFFSVDGGGEWIKLKGGVPTIAFRDLAIQRREDDLVGATFGRSFYVLDDYSALREVSEERLNAEVLLFGVRDAWWYIPQRPLGQGGKASQGAAYFTAPNPPFGAVFTYYLKDDLQTRQEARRAAEKELAKQGGDTPYPGWEALRAEELEPPPALLFTVRDAAGEVVRHLDAPAKQGFHRIAWDLRYPSFAPWKPSATQVDDDDDEEEFSGGGLLAPPGSYTVSVAKRVDGRLVELGLEQTFEVKPLRAGGALPGATPAEVGAFQYELAALQRSVQGAGAALDDGTRRIEAIESVLLRSTVGDPALGDSARDIARRLAELKLRLEGDARREFAGDPGPVSISARVAVVFMGNRWSTHGPTASHRENFDIARRQMKALAADLDGILRVDLPALESRLDAAGVPWSPGRSAPPLEDDGG